MSTQAERDKAAKQKKEQFAKNLKVLDDMLKLPENKECADCRARGPRWASTNLGVFICIRCSGIHRSLGVHISKVKSVTLDAWPDEQVEQMQRLGNAKVNEIYEANVPSNWKNRNLDSDQDLERWIRAKYEKKEFMRKGGFDDGSDDRSEKSRRERERERERDRERERPREEKQDRTYKKEKAPAQPQRPAQSPLEDLLDFGAALPTPAPASASFTNAAPQAGPAPASPPFGSAQPTASSQLQNSLFGPLSGTAPGSQAQAKQPQSSVDSAAAAAAATKNSIMSLFQQPAATPFSSAPATGLPGGGMAGNTSGVGLSPMYANPATMPVQQSSPYGYMQGGMMAPVQMSNPSMAQQSAQARPSMPMSGGAYQPYPTYGNVPAVPNQPTMGGVGASMLGMGQFSQPTMIASPMTNLAGYPNQAMAGYQLSGVPGAQATGMAGAQQVGMYQNQPSGYGWNPQSSNPSR